MQQDTPIRIGVLYRTFGLAGALGCTPDTDAVPVITTPCPAWVGYSASFLEPIELLRVEMPSKELICYFKGITDRTAAQGLLDRALFLPASAISYENALADPGLVGCDVRDEAGEPLGQIEAIFRTPAHFVWQILSPEGEWLLPAINQFVIELRAAERVAIVRPIPGMVAGRGGEVLDD